MRDTFRRLRNRLKNQRRAVQGENALGIPEDRPEDDEESAEVAHGLIKFKVGLIRLKISRIQRLRCFRAASATPLHSTRFVSLLFFDDANAACAA